MELCLYTYVEPVIKIETSELLFNCSIQLLFNYSIQLLFNYYPGETIQIQL